MTRKWPVHGVFFAGLWILVRGVPLDLPTMAGEFIIGLFVGTPIAYGFRRFYTAKWAMSPPRESLPYGALYLAVFVKELITANVDVARRVVDPRMPINPDVIEVPLRVQTDVAITTIANSITLTPGTLTMDYNQERNSLYVHAITADDYDTIVDPIRSWEDYALKIFAEERNPGDPVPDPDVVERETVTEEATEDPAVTEADGGDADGE